MKFHQPLVVRVMTRLERVQSQLSSHRGAGFLFATALVAIATLGRLGLGLITNDVLVFATFYPAVVFSALFAGFGPGLFAAFLGGLIAWWAFMSPPFAFFPLTLGQQIGLATYAFVSFVMVYGADRNRLLTVRLRENERLRQIAVEELGHRLKNKVATIQALVSLQLYDLPGRRAEIVERLQVLASTDDLLVKSQGVGARLSEIMSTEVGTYGASRVSFAGPDISLPPALAVTMAMLVHELATNAAKYGALSGTDGKVSVSWSVSDGLLELTWRECGGPTVVVPVRRGFGMRLLSGALSQAGGTASTMFDPAGLECTMKIPLPSASSLILSATQSSDGLASDPMRDTAD